jgi:hypothetical protein
LQILVNENQSAHTIEKEGSVYRVLRKSGFLEAFCKLKSHGIVIVAASPVTGTE